MQVVKFPKVMEMPIITSLKLLQVNLVQMAVQLQDTLLLTIMETVILIAMFNRMMKITMLEETAKEI